MLQTCQQHCDNMRHTAPLRCWANIELADDKGQDTNLFGTVSLSRALFYLISWSSQHSSTKPTALRNKSIIRLQNKSTSKCSPALSSILIQLPMRIKRCQETITRAGPLTLLPGNISWHLLSLKSLPASRGQQSKKLHQQTAVLLCMHIGQQEDETLLSLVVRSHLKNQKKGMQPHIKILSRLSTKLLKAKVNIFTNQCYWSLISNLCYLLTVIFKHFVIVPSLYPRKCENLKLLPILYGFCKWFYKPFWFRVLNDIAQGWRSE